MRNRRGDIVPRQDNAAAAAVRPVRRPPRDMPAASRGVQRTLYGKGDPLLGVAVIIAAKIQNG